MKRIAHLFQKHVSPDKVEALAAEKTPSPLERESKSRVVMVLGKNGADPFGGPIGDVLESIGVRQDVWFVEALAPVTALSADVDPKLLDFSGLALGCMDAGCSFVAAVGQVDFGLIGTGTRLSYGSVTPLWSKLIAAMFMGGSDGSWLSVELWQQTNCTGLELREVAGMQFQRIE